MSNTKKRRKLVRWAERIREAEGKKEVENGHAER